MNSDAHVAVVGGGVAGLVVARDLARAGVRVTLFEAAPRFGGRIRVAEVAGLSLDIGAEAFATRGGQVEALATELGIGSSVVRPAALGSWLVAGTNGAAVPLPPAGAMGIPARPLASASRRALGLVGALRATIEPWLPRRIGRDSVTLAELVRVRAGSAVVDRLVRPVTLGVFSAPPERIPLTSAATLVDEYARCGSVIRAAARLRDSAAAAGGAVATLQGGMSELVDALAAAAATAGADLRLDTVVTGLSAGETVAEPGADQHRQAAVKLEIRTAQTQHAAELTDAAEPMGVDAVVLAVPEAAARSLLGSSVPEATTAQVEVVALVLDANNPAVCPLAAAPRGTGALVAAGGSDDVITAKALTHVTRKWPRDERKAWEVVRLSYGRDGAAPETDGLDDAAVQELALIDANRILGASLPRDAVVGFVRQRWEMPSRCAREHPKLPRGVSLVGDWVDGVGFAALIPAARATAASLATQLLPTTDSSERPAS